MSSTSAFRPIFLAWFGTACNGLFFQPPIKHHSSDTDGFCGWSNTAPMLRQRPLKQIIADRFECWQGITWLFFFTKRFHSSNLPDDQAALRHFERQHLGAELRAVGVVLGLHGVDRVG